VDANVFIDVFVAPTRYPKRLPGSLWVLEAAERGEHRLVVPAHVISETLCSGPMRPDAKALADQRKANVERFLTWVRDSRPLVVEVDQLLAVHAGRLGQALNIKGGDALILAAAMRAECTVLYSWDDDDLTRHDGEALLDGLRVVNPAVPPAALTAQLAIDDAVPEYAEAAFIETGGEPVDDDVPDYDEDAADEARHDGRARVTFIDAD
jgi:predicted nucleic acid-binding protein